MSTDIFDEPLYSTEDVARRYCVKPITVQRWVRQGRITALNIGGNRLGPYRFRLSDIQEFEQKASIQR